MKREFLDDNQVESEIERLNKSEAVKLARYEQRLIYRKRQYLYQLRWLEKRGLELMDKGMTMESMDMIYDSIKIDEGES